MNLKLQLILTVKSQLESIWPAAVASMDVGCENLCDHVKRGSLSLFVHQRDLLKHLALQRPRNLND